MNIYFAGSIRGGRDDLALYQKIIKELSLYGNVLTGHIGQENLSDEGEKNMTDSEIYERDMAWLAESDLIVAEISTPSLGVGYEIARAELMGIHMIGLHRRNALKRLSAMISGNSLIRVIEYDEFEDLRLKFAEELNPSGK